MNGFSCWPLNKNPIDRYKFSLTYSSNGADIDKWPASATTRPIGQPTPNQCHDDEYTGRGEGHLYMKLARFIGI